jgi:hypothetical protein
MVRKAHLFLLVFVMVSISLLAESASARPATLKCNSNRDQIWVYDSLNSFNVDAKLKCGEGVEIIERVPNYVKIRAQNGVEGYVPDAAVSDLPVLQPYRDSAHDVGMAAKQAQAAEIAKAAAQAASLAPADVNYSNIPRASASSISDSAHATVEKKEVATVSVAPSPALGALKPAPASATANPTPSTAVAEAKAPAVTPEVAAPTSVKPSSELPGHATASPAAIPPPSTVVSDSDSDSAPVSEQPASACQTYFSAYGLTPSQTKWIAKNREKAFSQVCPAPDPSKVDFVIIFTHDVDFFSGTMPQPVHKSSGFSDFTPMTPIDTALVPQSQADNARREYVWIFQFEKGTFDPASFSPKRQYQFSKMETGLLGSKAGVKTVEDAFRYLSTASR